MIHLNYIRSGEPIGSLKPPKTNKTKPKASTTAQNNNTAPSSTWRDWFWVNTTASYSGKYTVRQGEKQQFDSASRHPKRNLKMEYNAVAIR